MRLCPSIIPQIKERPSKREIRLPGALQRREFTDSRHAVCDSEDRGRWMVMPVRPVSCPTASAVMSEYIIYAVCGCIYVHLPVYDPPNKLMK
jgi:hypothetical protein